MKIAIIGSKGIPAKAGGVEKHVEGLALNLAKKGHEVFVYARKHYTGYNKEQYQGVKLIYLPSIKSKNLEAISHTFLATLDVLRRDVDIVHYHSVGPATLSFIPRIFKRKAKVIATFHCKDQDHQKWGKFAKMYLRFGEYAVNKFPSETITVSRGLALYSKKKFKRTAKFVPSGIDVKITDKTDQLAKFDLQKNGYLLFVSRLIKHKGAHYLIKAFKNIKTDKKLVIVGGSSHTDNYFSYLKKLAQNDPRIIFTDWQYGETLRQLFTHSYLHVHPSDAEGQPITVLEALGYGRPVLISDIEEHVDSFKEIAIFFQQGNITDLQKKLEFYLANPQALADRIKNSGNFIKNNHNWDKIVDTTLAIYQEAINNERRNLPELVPNNFCD